MLLPKPSSQTTQLAILRQEPHGVTNRLHKRFWALVCLAPLRVRLTRRVMPTDQLGHELRAGLGMVPVVSGPKVCLGVNLLFWTVRLGFPHNLGTPTRRLLSDRPKGSITPSDSKTCLPLPHSHLPPPTPRKPVADNAVPRGPRPRHPEY